MTAGDLHRRRAHVVMSDDLLCEIDARVGRRRRSEFIQEAVEEKLRRLRLAGSFQRVVGSVADGDIPEWETRESTAEWLQSLRQGWESDRSSSSFGS
jgi:hypothetical protein